MTKILPPVDSDDILKMIEDDDYKETIIYKRLTEIENGIKILKNNYDQENISSLITMIHNFRGSPIMFGRNSLIQVAQQLEVSLKQHFDQNKPIAPDEYDEIQKLIILMKEESLTKDASHK